MQNATCVEADRFSLLRISLVWLMQAQTRKERKRNGRWHLENVACPATDRSQNTKSKSCGAGLSFPSPVWTKTNANSDSVTNGWKLVRGKETNALETNIAVQEAA